MVLEIVSSRRPPECWSNAVIVNTFGDSVLGLPAVETHRLPQCVCNDRQLPNLTDRPDLKLKVPSRRAAQPAFELNLQTSLQISVHQWPTQMWYPNVNALTLAYRCFVQLPSKVSSEKFLCLHSLLVTSRIVSVSLPLVPASHLLRFSSLEFSGRVFPMAFSSQPN